MLLMVPIAPYQTNLHVGGVGIEEGEMGGHVSSDRACCTHNCDCVIASLTLCLLNIGDVGGSDVYTWWRGYNLSSHHNLSLVGLEHAPSVSG